MKDNLRKIVLILSILFAMFISLFALDVFEQEKWVLALIIHLIPTYVVIILTIISWKKELLGGILWIITATIVMFTTEIGWIITLPMIIIGGLNIVVEKMVKK